MALEAVSRQTLDGVPGRVLAFLIGIGVLQPVRAALMARGYSQAEHEYAWNRLQQLGAIPVEERSVAQTPVKKASVELDVWDEPGMACIEATLDRHHPEQGKFVMNNLGPSQGDAAVVGVDLLLTRLDQLETGKGRPEASRKEDLAALVTLAERGYTKEERLRLRELVTIAKTAAPAVVLSDDERTRTLMELYAWLNEWATQAKTLVTKRSHLIRLGLAKPRKAKQDQVPVPVPPVVPTSQPTK